MSPSTQSRTEDISVELRQFFDAEPKTLIDAAPLYRRLLNEAPAIRFGGQIVLSAYEFVDRVYRDSVQFDSNVYDEGTLAGELRERIPPALAEQYDDLARFEDLLIWRLAGDDHRRVRGIVAPAFFPREVARLEQVIYDQCDELLSAAGSRDHFDLVSDFGYRLPLLMVSWLLDVPSADMLRIHEWSMTWAAFQGRTNLDAVGPWYDALQQARSYIDDVLERFAQAPPQAAFARSLLEAHEQGQMTRDELLAMFIGLLFAAHETTTNLIANGTRVLLQHRDQWERLCEDPTLAANAVEELLRFESPARYSRRLPTRSAQFGDVAVQAGETVCVLIGAANRDPDVFENPDQLDVTRDARRHLAFAAGAKYCLGAPLARMEGRIAFEMLSRRYPDLQLASDHFDPLPVAIMNGVRSVPVRTSRPLHAG